MKRQWMTMAGALALAWSVTTVEAQSPVIESFGSNGALVCTNLQPGSTASVEWASSVTGPWTNSWAGLAAVAADTNGAIRASVPMFYRVRGMPAIPAGMVWIPAGAFTMGDTFHEGFSGELPLHTNHVSAFFMDKFAVTKGLWDDVYAWAIIHGYSFDYGADGKANDHPAQNVTWYDALKWCNARSEKEGRVPAYYTDPGHASLFRSGQADVENGWVKWNVGYRLPTEAEWEKAARGGAIGHRFPWADRDTISHTQANYYAAANSPYNLSYPVGNHPAFAVGDYPYTSPVGYFAANSYGLYDMAGNVRNWCWDWAGAYASGAQTDPRGPNTGTYREIRGGYWDEIAFICRAACRGSNYPEYRSSGVGFRTVLVPDQL